MKNSAIQDSIGKIGFRSWPLFKEFRNSEQFKKSYFEIYEEEYIPNPQKDMETEAVVDHFLSQKEDLNDCDE